MSDMPKRAGPYEWLYTDEAEYIRADLVDELIEAITVYRNARDTARESGAITALNAAIAAIQEKG